MSFFKDAGQSFLKYSEKLVEKTEIYTKIAKLTLEIKKLESTIDRTYTEIGKYVVEKIDSGINSVTLEDDFVGNSTRKIRECRELIETKRNEIAEIKNPPPPAEETVEESTPGGTSGL